MIALMYATLGRLQTMRRHLANALDLNASEFAVVMTLLRAVKEGGLRVRAIADELHVAAANVTATVAKLERSGWIVKKPDHTDNRAISIQLTRHARNKLESFADGLHSVNDVWFQDITNYEFRAVVTFFKNLIRRYPAAVGLARGLRGRLK
jgi:DNA-binding MarR family transcriptional regulator